MVEDGFIVKKINLLIVITLVLLVLVGCNRSKLSEAYNEDEVIKSAISIVSLLNSQDYKEIENKSSDILRSQLPVEKIKEVWEPIRKSAGKFIEIKKETVVGNGDYATAAVMASYENTSVVFTISFNESLELEGLFFK